MQPTSNATWKTLQVGWQALTGLICPPECHWCQCPVPSGDGLCSECRQRLVAEYYHCQRCATPLPSVVPNRDCFRCRNMDWKFRKIIALGPYRGRLREAAILMKKNSAERFRQYAGRLLAERLRQVELVAAQPKGKLANGLAAPLVVPVPNYWSHPFARTANTAASLAQAISDRLDWPLNTRAVSRVRKTAKQGMLSWTERKLNVRGAFKLRTADAFAGKHVFLIDDVLTSGATAAELARIILKGGARQVDVAVVARGTGAREVPQAPLPAG
ncbi:phosphoribosyltransferase family protein [Aureliella helgolandensis]|uniref:DNA utilization protein GntX n=1 Tax=Aureliella helgolandensis TaxID=2527968 RepID=A0A518G5B1_9BACT|nr:phosphoribosyltransferase family protein [Aureliella helgolandensis]QDV23772.1 DNA utilization protein GntX [Aureliella helgolandensis]